MNKHFEGGLTIFPMPKQTQEGWGGESRFGVFFFLSVVSQGCEGLGLSW